MISPTRSVIRARTSVRALLDNSLWVTSVLAYSLGARAAGTPLLATEGGLRAALGNFRDATESARKNLDALDPQRGDGHGHLTIPVLGISSSHGSIPDMAASLRPWAENVTGVVIEDAGHLIPDEQPDATAAALTSFIDNKPDK